jgi:hypothetical protein
MIAKLTGRQERAAALVAEDRYSDERIAEKVGVVKRTLAYWKKQPSFLARVQGITEELAAHARRRGIARRERRLAVLQETHNKLLQVIEERAADPSMAEIPGGTTGHVIRKPVVFGAKVVGYEYAVDTGTIRQLQSVLEQAAKELGQIVERHEHRVIRSIEDLTDDELTAIETEAQKGALADRAALASVTATSPEP